MQVLIVDDNIPFVQRLVRLLHDGGIQEGICISSDYDGALAAMDNCQPDVVLLDINLPGKNGLAVLQQIRKSGIRPAVIMLTNHVDDYYRDRCRELGTDYFLDKSNDFSLVPGIIHQLKENEHPPILSTNGLRN
ncbi:MAG TPA: response regulator [Chitinophagaceae bacterium]|nr:response regulator [Chitinophagaceae bacterium]